MIFMQYINKYTAHEQYQSEDGKHVLIRDPFTMWCYYIEEVQVDRDLYRHDIAERNNLQLGAI